jgi:hypothetical protein
MAPARPIHTHEGEAGPRRTVSQVSNPQILLQIQKYFSERLIVDSGAQLAEL